MTSKKVNQTIFRATRVYTYDTLCAIPYKNSVIKFIINKLEYLRINTFKYFNYSNKLNMLIWVNKNEKTYTYIKKKKKKNDLKTPIIKKIKKRKITLPNLQNENKTNYIKLILIKALLNKFFFKKQKINFIDCQRLNVYCEAVTRHQKQKAINLTKHYLEVLKFPLVTKRIKRSRKNLLVFQLIFAGLLGDAYSVSKIIARSMQRNKNQKAILALIEFVVSKIFLVTMNFKGITIQINGKFLKKFGNKKIRATKQKIILGKHIPKQSINQDIDYGFSEAKTYLGVLSIHVWIKKT